MIKEKSKMKLLSLTVCLVLIAAMARCLTGCGKNAVETAGINLPSSQIEMGEGEKSFSLIVADPEGNETAFKIQTDKETVGEALEELKLIDGEIGKYGLYIKTVNGITVDPDDGSKYWAFYVNNEYATSGVDTTPVEDGAIYALRVQK